MTAMTVHHLDRDRFAVAVRDHLVVVDQPLGDGGGDDAPTPTELLVASLASCVATYVRRYLVRHQLPSEGLVVHTEYAVGGHPIRVTDVRVSLDLPAGVPAERYRPLLAIANRCTVHNTLIAPPAVTIDLAVAAAVVG